MSRWDRFWGDLAVYFGLREETADRAADRRAQEQVRHLPTLARINVGLVVLVEIDFVVAFLWRTLEGGNTGTASTARLAGQLLLIGGLATVCSTLLRRRR